MYRAIERTVLKSVERYRAEGNQFQIVTTIKSFDGLSETFLHKFSINAITSGRTNIYLSIHTKSFNTCYTIRLST